jgi:hypothetical protein
MKSKSLIVICLAIAFLIGYLYGYRVAQGEQQRANQSTLHKSN